jgi:hypothetical protein
LILKEPRKFFGAQLPLDEALRGVEIQPVVQYASWARLIV